MKILIANRGEIAIRIMRTCKEMGYETAAIYTKEDETALHVRYADEAFLINDVNGYMQPRRIVEIAKKAGVNAVHPGYGFLSENKQFASLVEENGIHFIGPKPETIGLFGDKLAARKLAREQQVPVLPGPDQPIADTFSIEMADDVTFPVLVKATAGGGGKGIYLANDADELPQVIEAAKKEAGSIFGNDQVYLEPLVQQARHIEVQILGDGKGNIICLGDRECSIQRRRQKLIEEAPFPFLDEGIRAVIHQAAMRICKSIAYRSLGTVEFLLDKDGSFHFIEVNPRIQVEHPVTEMITRKDLVREQLEIALQGKTLDESQPVIFYGAAIESRILAEDPNNGFLPVTGMIEQLKEPGGFGVRVDSSLFAGMQIIPQFDSMLAKVITWGETRQDAVSRLSRALEEFRIDGIQTDIPLLEQVIISKRFKEGLFDTNYLDTFSADFTSEDGNKKKEAAIAAAIVAHLLQGHTLPANGLDEQLPDYWKMTAWREQMRS